MQILKAFELAWFKIFNASSLLVAARSLAASIPCKGEESYALFGLVQILLLLAVGAVAELCSNLYNNKHNYFIEVNEETDTIGLSQVSTNLRQSSVVLARQILRIACSATFDGLLRWTSRTPV